MRRATNKVDQWLYALGHAITRFRFIFLAGLIALLAGMIIHLPKTTVDTTTEGFLHESDPVRIAYDEFRDQFGRDERIVVAIKTDGIFHMENLKKLQSLHNELRDNVPYLNDITSLVNARNTKGEGNELLVEDLLESWPQNVAELEAVRATALANPLYTNLMISEDGTFTVIILESNTYTSVGVEPVDVLAGFDETFSAASAEKPAFITDEENSEMVRKVREIVGKHQAEGFDIYVAGSPSVTESLKSSMKSDIKKFNLLIILTIIIFLGLLFRRVSGVLFPLLAVVLSVLATMGVMAAAGTPIKIPTQILPSFLLAVGIGASVHVLAIFFHHYDKYGDKNESIAYTLRHSGLAIIMTSLTTAVGIGSFAFSSVAPVADLGLYGALGVIIALILSMVFLPTLLAVFPVRRKAYHSPDHKDRMERILTAIAHFSQDRAKAIVVSSVIFMALALALASQMYYSHNPIKWLSNTNETRTATELIDEKMRGTISLELLIDTGKENGLYDYELLKTIESIGTYAESIHNDDYFVGKVVSIADVIKEIHRALNENQSAFYDIPQNPNLIAQEILLFENSGSDDLEDFVDTQFSKARITLKMPWIDAVKYHGMMDDLKAYLDTKVPANVEVTLTGMIPLLSNTITAAIVSAGESYALAIILISLMMVLLLANIKLGLVSMIPNLFPIFFIMGFMVAFNIPFDLFTMLVGSIVLGLAVDDNVHFMHNFRRYYDEGKSVEEAVRLTLTGTGRAMLITTIVLSLGFFVYLFASMGNLVNFGLLAGLAIVVALVADFLLAPALMALLYKNKKETL